MRLVTHATYVETDTRQLRNGILAHSLWQRKMVSIFIVVNSIGVIMSSIIARMIVNMMILIHHVILQRINRDMDLLPPSFSPL